MFVHSYKWSIKNINKIKPHDFVPVTNRKHHPFLMFSGIKRATWYVVFHSEKEFGLPFLGTCVTLPMSCDCWT